MRRMMIGWLSLMLVATAAIANPELAVSMHSKTIQKTADLGHTQVKGIGQVRFTARRQGSQIIVRALGPDNKMIGKAESFIGLKETLIYLKGGHALTPFTILWGQDLANK